MPRTPLTDDTDYEPPTSDPREPFPVPGSVEPTSPAPPPVPIPDPVPPAPAPTPPPDVVPPPADEGQVDPKGSRLRRGWSAANTQIDKNSSYAKAFKPEENITYVIRFLEPDPYATFNRHWVPRPSQKGNTVNVPFTCLRSDGIDKPCPLCDVAGDAPKSVTSFNIAVVEKDGTVTLKSFDTTPTTFRTVQNFARDELYSPLPRRWWSVKKVKGARGFSEINLTPIMSDASLLDDYGYKVPSDVDLKSLDLYGPEIVQVRSTSELMEIATEMAAQDENPYGDT